jgi:hypothetical protein
MQHAVSGYVTRAATVRSRDYLLGILALVWTTGCDSGASAPAPSSSAHPSALPLTSATQGSAAAPPPSSGAPSSPAPTASASAALPAQPGAIAKLQDDVRRDPDTFNGKHVRVDGLYVGTSRRDIGPLVGDSYHPLLVVDVLVADAKDDREHTILCEMTTWKPPPGLAELDRVTVEGRGYIDTPANGRKLVISACTLTRGAVEQAPQ